MELDPRKMHPQVTNILIMLIMIGLGRFINTDNPTILTIIRILYIASITTTLSIYYITKQRIKKANDLKVLKYVKGNSMTSAEYLMGQKESLETITVRDYDMKDIDAALRSTYQSILMMFLMHVVMKYNNPLFMQLVSPVKNAVENNVVKIHSFGKPAVGDLKRPFAGGTLFGVSTGGNYKTDKKTIEEFEMAGYGGTKFE